METTTTESSAEIVATLRLPITFWSDHASRTAEEYPVGTVIKWMARTVTATFTQDEFDNLLSDADYYADCARCGEWNRSDDPGLWALGQSAIRTMEAISKQTA